MWKLNSIIDMHGENPYLIFINHGGDVKLICIKGHSMHLLFSTLMEIEQYYNEKKTPLMKTNAYEFEK